MSVRHEANRLEVNWGIIVALVIIVAFWSSVVYPVTRVIG